MSGTDIRSRLAILADAAKYDASCASSGSTRRNSRSGGIGSTGGMGICHSYAPDGRCISLLKILLTNHCVYDCLYCVNRVSSDTPRARFTPDEAADLTMAFYKRNYIEGLFLSSGIVKSPDHTMEQIIRVARLLRETHEFRGYIHLKTIPECDPALIAEAGLWADRLSVNIELPREQSLREYAPQKNVASIRGAMAGLRLRIDEAREEKVKGRRAPQFAPAGQSTQMIVGADNASDVDILRTSSTLYSSYELKRVYYSAFSPIPGAGAKLPPVKPPLMREHRLYQADWLYRFYGFSVDEIAQGARDQGMLPLDMDPKLAWALVNRAQFPVDVNKASREELLRVPGLGVKSVTEILRLRRLQRLRIADLTRLSRSRDVFRPFVVAADWRPASALDDAHLGARLRGKPQQLSLF
ncbi:MAG: putative DNA modification/repair radical SAM protein [Beijerinckiaceae bacterium]